MDDGFVLDKINNHEKRLIDIELNQVETKLLLKQSIETNTKLSNTMEDIKITMVGVQQALKTNKDDIDDINCKIDSLSSKITCEENKSKIDLREVIKDTFYKILLMIFSGSMVYVFFNLRG
jgi:predicted  nucleic acid-binding Zn-ribbon protein